MLDECKWLVLGHVDMMFHLLCQRGFGVTLPVPQEEWASR